MPVHDIVRLVECILSLSPAACVKELHVPALPDTDVSTLPALPRGHTHGRLRGPGGRWFAGQSTPAGVALWDLRRRELAFGYTRKAAPSGPRLEP